jgi:tetratricopeptide (TPR) repeat protein
MAAKIANINELFHRFHTCEMYVKQGKIATCLISFKEIIDTMKSIPATDKEKEELHTGIDGFLKNLSAHKKFKEIFGDVAFGDTNLETNLEFIKSMIVAQEQEIVDKVNKDEETAEAQRLESVKIEEKKKEELQNKIDGAIKLIDEDKLSQATELIGDTEAIRDSIILHYNSLGMQNREIKNFSDAVKNYSKALSVSEQDENLHYNIARAYFEDGRIDQAEKFIRKALKLNPGFNEGKVFNDYLEKVEAAKRGAAGSPAGRLAGLIKRFLPFKGKQT